MRDRIVTMVVVVVATALVWLYAEAESLSRTQQDASVTLVGVPERLTARAAVEDWRGVARLTVEGTTAAVSRAPRKFALTPGAPGFPAEEGEHTIDLRAALRSDPELARSGVTLLSVEPATVRVRVVALATLGEVPVRAEAPGVLLAGAPTVEPGRATVVGPRATVERLASQPGGASVVARPTGAALAALPEGRPARVQGRVSLPPGFDEADVAISPREVEITLTKGLGETLAVQPPAVEFVLPAEEVGRWRVTPTEESRFVRGVTLTGPPAAIDRFRNGELRVAAVVWLTREELEGGAGVEPVSLLAAREGALTGLPAGVVAEAPEKVVRFTAERVGQ